MVETITDMYGVDDDEDGAEGNARIETPAAISTRMGGMFSDIAIGGSRVSIPNADYVRQLEARLVDAERMIRRLGNEVRDLQVSSRRRVSELDEMRRRLDGKADVS